MGFAAGLKYYRLLKKLSQIELAAAINNSNKNISNWEKGISKPDIDILVKISEILCISMDDLVNYPKKIENFVEKNVRAKCEGKNVRAKDVLLGQNASPKQYHLADGLLHDFAADLATDQEQIDNLNEFIKGLQQAIDQKNLLLAAKDELLAVKDQTIATQNNALKLLEGQINATTALIEELTRFLGNDAKNRTESADV